MRGFGSNVGSWDLHWPATSVVNPAAAAIVLPDPPFVKSQCCAETSFQLSYFLLLICETEAIVKIAQRTWFENDRRPREPEKPVFRGATPHLCVCPRFWLLLGAVGWGLLTRRVARIGVERSASEKVFSEWARWAWTPISCLWG